MTLNHIKLLYTKQINSIFSQTSFDLYVSKLQPNTKINNPDISNVHKKSKTHQFSRTSTNLNRPKVHSDRHSK